MKNVKKKRKKIKKCKRKRKRKKCKIILRKIIKIILRLRFFYFTKNVKK